MHRNQKSLEASRFLIFSLMEKIDTSWKSIDFLCCNLWESEKLKINFCSILWLFKRKNFREACLNYLLYLMIQIFISIQTCPSKQETFGSCTNAFKSALELLNCITHLNSLTNRNWKYISIAVIKKRHLTLLLDIKSSRK